MSDETPTTEQVREKAIQANEIADVVFDEIKRVWPDLHPLLDLRYGVADKLWELGYRKPNDLEYAIISTAGEHLWPLGNYDEEFATTYADCVEALDHHDPDYWDGDERIMQRSKASPWQAASPISDEET